MELITDINQLDLNKRYTYADYLTWQFEERVELINGKVYLIREESGFNIHRVSTNLFLVIGNLIKERGCDIFHAPFDVRLPLSPEKQTKGKIDTVVQPDICVICDPSKQDDKGCSGAPDWIIEILSKGTAKKDLNDKFDLYQFVGVKEYWIVHPHDGTVIAYILNAEGKYEPIRVQPFTAPDVVPVSVLSDFSVDLSKVFVD